MSEINDCGYDACSQHNRVWLIGHPKFVVHLFICMDIVISTLDSTLSLGSTLAGITALWFWTRHFQSALVSTWVYRDGWTSHWTGFNPGWDHCATWCFWARHFPFKVPFSLLRCIEMDAFKFNAVRSTCSIGLASHPSRKIIHTPSRFMRQKSG